MDVFALALIFCGSVLCSFCNGGIKRKESRYKERSSFGADYLDSYEETRSFSDGRGTSRYGSARTVDAGRFYEHTGREIETPENGAGAGYDYDYDSEYHGGTYSEGGGGGDEGSSHASGGYHGGSRSRESLSAGSGGSWGNYSGSAVGSGSYSD